MFTHERRQFFQICVRARVHPQDVIAADRSSQAAAEHLRIATYACGLTDLIDEFGPALLAAIGRVEEPRTGDGFQRNRQFTPTPGIAQAQGLFEPKLEKGLGLTLAVTVGMANCLVRSLAMPR